MNRLRNIIRYCNDGGFWIILMVLLSISYGISMFTMGQSEWDHLTSYTVCEQKMFGIFPGWSCPYTNDEGEETFESITKNEINNRWFNEEILPFIINKDEKAGDVLANAENYNIVVIRGEFEGEWTGIDSISFMMIPDHILPRVDELVQANNAKNN